MTRRAVAGLLFLGLASFVASKPAPTSTPDARRTPAPPRLDFSGTWRLDPRLSANVSARMERTVLDVKQKGDRIWISPGRAKMAIMAEEIVADGRPYEKALGNGGTGIVTAVWAPDGKSLRLEVTAGDVIQRSIWKLSSDRTVWVRETNTIDHGARRSSRLVFRRDDPKRTPTPGKDVTRKP